MKFLRKDPYRLQLMSNSHVYKFLASIFAAAITAVAFVVAIKYGLNVLAFVAISLSVISTIDGLKKITAYNTEWTRRSLVPPFGEMKAYFKQESVNEIRKSEIAV